VGLSVPSITRVRQGSAGYNDFETSEWTDIFVLSVPRSRAVLREEGGDWVAISSRTATAYRVESFRPRRGFFSDRALTHWATARRTGFDFARERPVVYGLDQNSRIADR